MITFELRSNWDEQLEKDIPSVVATKRRMTFEAMSCTNNFSPFLIFNAQIESIDFMEALIEHYL